MKKLTVALNILLFAFYFASAQQMQNDDPVKNLDRELMAKFNGTWEWKSNEDSFTLVLKSDLLSNTDPSGLQFVSGWYRYIKNGKVIVDNLAEVGNTKSAAFMGYIKKGDPTLRISFSDKTRDRVRHGTIIFTANSQTAILLKIDPREMGGVHIQVAPLSKTDTIPRSLKMVLHKIK